MGRPSAFHPGLPAWGMDADADLVVTSVHKMGGAIEQSSVFHLQHDRVAPEVLKQREDLLGTTSASSWSTARWTAGAARWPNGVTNCWTPRCTAPNGSGPCCASSRDCG